MLFHCLHRSKINQRDHRIINNGLGGSASATNFLLGAEGAQSTIEHGMCVVSAMFCCGIHVDDKQTETRVPPGLYPNIGLLNRKGY